MWGAIIGDIIGSRYEFTDGPNDINFDLFTPFNNFTDDTICTVAMADALLSNKDYIEKLKYWCNKFPNAGYGAMFEDWLYMDSPVPYKSKGNGAMMRISPVANYYWEKKYSKRQKEVFKATYITHNTKEALIGAIFVTELIVLGREGFTKDEAINIIKNINLFKKYKIHLTKDKNSELTDDTLKKIVYCLENGNGFEELIRLAINLGGDTDTTAAIVGSIAEAFYEIPKELIENAKQYLPKEIINIVLKFEEEK